MISRRNMLKGIFFAPSMLATARPRLTKSSYLYGGEPIGFRQEKLLELTDVANPSAGYIAVTVTSSKKRTGYIPAVKKATGNWYLTVRLHDAPSNLRGAHLKVEWGKKQSRSCGYHLEGNDEFWGFIKVKSLLKARSIRFTFTR